MRRSSIGYDCRRMVDAGLSCVGLEDPRQGHHKGLHWSG